MGACPQRPGNISARANAIGFAEHRISETVANLNASKSRSIGIVLDAANCWLQSGESPQHGAAGMQHAIVHVHVKDLRKCGDRWVPVLNGQGTFPLEQMRLALRSIGSRKPWRI